jgi:glycosyltransferase involved in cell wall biosynthesis
MKNEIYSRGEQNGITPFLISDLTVDQDIAEATLVAGPYPGYSNHPDRQLPEILFVTSYPPRECGIATYSQDLLKALNNKFAGSFSLKVCALEAGIAQQEYPEEVKYVLDTTNPENFTNLAHEFNQDERIRFILVQHEFGFFQGAGEVDFLQFLYTLTKPIVIVFHTVLPQPDEETRQKVRKIAAAAASVVTMTNNSANILNDKYGIEKEKIEVIAHGTHLVPHLSKTFLKEKYGLAGRKILSTFGLLSSGKSIETTLDALPNIIKTNPAAFFLILGKTHPGVVKSEGEKYRAMLEEKIEALNLQNHVKFVNRYLPLSDLLEYLQMTDIYLFTSKDRNQAVSGTFSYAMSCGCPIISTPIPHAREVLRNDTGILIDFQNSDQLAASVNRLLGDKKLLASFSNCSLQRIVPTAWENSAIAHARLLQKLERETTLSGAKITLKFNLPEINLMHLKKMTTDFGMIQFAKINQPDLESGYTLDDNARALIAICMHYELTITEDDLYYVRTYLNFIGHCQFPGGRFLNYVDKNRRFTEQNEETNLSDSNGRAIWALGYLISRGNIIPGDLLEEARKILFQAIPHIKTMHSTRAMAFSIKGLYYADLEQSTPEIQLLLKDLANRLVQMYRHEAEPDWYWFESYLTYGNSILPEALLCAFRATGNPDYREIAKKSFDFLLSMTFEEHRIVVVSNNGWLQKGQKIGGHGEQPIDVAYTIMALREFGKIFPEEGYATKMTTAFNWFLGNNHLHQIVYNPCTGGCYDGLEACHLNLNQGAESTLSYLMARMTVENTEI